MPGRSHTIRRGDTRAWFAANGATAALVGRAHAARGRSPACWQHRVRDHGGARRPGSDHGARHCRLRNSPSAVARRSAPPTSPVAPGRRSPCGTVQLTSDKQSLSMSEVVCTVGLGVCGCVQRSADIWCVHGRVHEPAPRSVLLCTIPPGLLRAGPRRSGVRPGRHQPVRCQAGVLTNGQLCEFREVPVSLLVRAGRDSHNISHNSWVVTGCSARMRGWS